MCGKGKEYLLLSAKNGTIHDRRATTRTPFPSCAS
jgi:hypothetical protein